MAKNTEKTEDDPLDEMLFRMRDPSWRYLPEFLKELKKSDPLLYDKIDSTVYTTWEEVVTVLISEVACKATERRVKAIELLYRVLLGPNHRVQPPSEYNRPFIQISENLQQTVMELLSTRLQDPNHTVRRFAASALRSFTGRYPHEVVDILVEFGINNEDYQTARAAMSSLLEAGPDAASVAVPKLCDCAEHHKHEQARESACNTLRDLGEKTQEVLSTLVKRAVDDTSQNVRLSAIRALQELFKLELIFEKLNEAVSDKSKLNADLVKGGEKFRQLRRGLQNVDEPPVSDQPGSRSTPRPTTPRETPEAVGPTSPELSAATSDQLTQTPTGSASVDGPQTPNRFVWDGKCAELQPISWDLVNFVWHENDDHKAEEDDVFDAVWPDSGRSQGALKSAISRANDSLMVKGIPISVNQKKGYVIITIKQN